MLLPVCPLYQSTARSSLLSTSFPPGLVWPLSSPHSHPDTAPAPVNAISEGITNLLPPRCQGSIPGALPPWCLVAEVFNLRVLLGSLQGLSKKTRTTELHPDFRSSGSEKDPLMCISHELCFDRSCWLGSHTQNTASSQHSPLQLQLVPTQLTSPMLVFCPVGSVASAS